MCVCVRVCVCVCVCVYICWLAIVDITASFITSQGRNSRNVYTIYCTHLKMLDTQYMGWSSTLDEVRLL